MLRYYDPAIGQFTTIDKATQFASGFTYCGNNPVTWYDKDGDFAFLVGAVFGAIAGFHIANMKHAHGLKFMLYVFGGAIIGGASAYVGDYISTAYTEIGGLAASSAINSKAFSELSGQGATVINFGFGVFNTKTGKVDWANPFQSIRNGSDALASLSHLTSLGAVAKDAFRLQIAIRGDDDPSVQIYKEFPREDGKFGEANYKRHSVDPDRMDGIIDDGKRSVKTVCRDGTLDHGD
ncbi:MAG: RHS repeat-associated core domain-containing protein [Candidatus Zixiibacteriota bacterium]